LSSGDRQRRRGSMTANQHSRIDHQVKPEPKSNSTLRGPVEREIEARPYERDGLHWAARPQASWAEELGVSTRTIQRRAKAEGLIYLSIRGDEGKKLFLLRPDDGSPVPTLQAKQMRDILKKTGRDFEKCSIADKKDFGCCHQLARDWGHDAVPRFRIIVENWSTFMVGVGLQTHQEIAEKLEANAQEAGEDTDQEIEKRYKREKMFYRYPFPALMRKYPEVAEETVWMVKQEEKSKQLLNPAKGQAAQGRCGVTRGASAAP